MFIVRGVAIGVAVIVFPLILVNAVAAVARKTCRIGSGGRHEDSDRHRRQQLHQARAPAYIAAHDDWLGDPLEAMAFIHDISPL
jgi:hypothetical protein